jgi:hypothetical protein
MAALGESVELTEELEKKLKELNLADAKETKARFKLEVYFAGGPRRGTEFKGVLCAWANGGFLNGGGDASVYFCPKVLARGSAEQTCLHPIDMRFVQARRAVCVHCRSVTGELDLVGQIINTMEIAKWARLITHMFHRLGCNADLRICVARGSIRRAKELETERDRGGEQYARVTAQREWITYPLASIIRDTSSGSPLERRIRAFLEA